LRIFLSSLHRWELMRRRRFLHFNKAQQQINLKWWKSKLWKKINFKSLLVKCQKAHVQMCSQLWNIWIYKCQGRIRTYCKEKWKIFCLILKNCLAFYDGIEWLMTAVWITFTVVVFHIGKSLNYFIVIYSL